MERTEGLIAAYLLDGKGGGTPMDWEQITRWQPGDGLMWVHLDYTRAESREWLERNSGLEAIAAEALLAEETRPRCTLIGGRLLLILRGVNHNPGSDPEDMVSIRIWTDGNRIISTRKRRLLSIGDLTAAIDKRCGPSNSSEFIVELGDLLSTRMADVIAQLDDSIDELEEEVLTLQSHKLRPRLSAVRRETIALRRYLSPQRDALQRLAGERLAWFGESERSRLREVTDRTTRYIEELDASRERAIVIQEELLSRLSEQMDSRMYLLSIVAALFLPLGFLTGLLGINVGGIPGTDNPLAFTMVTAGLAVLLVVMVMLLRARRWF